MPALKEAPHLKPCPFCGCKLESKWNRPNPSARCASENCIGGKLPVLCLDDEGSIDAWNKRTLPAQPAPTEQELVKWCDYEPNGMQHNKPSQRTWVGLTKEDKDLVEDLCDMMIGDAAFSTIDAILKGNNGFA